MEYIFFDNGDVYVGLYKIGKRNGMGIYNFSITNDILDYYYDEFRDDYFYKAYLFIKMETTMKEILRIK